MPDQKKLFQSEKIALGFMDNAMTTALESIDKLRVVFDRLATEQRLDGRDVVPDILKALEEFGHAQRLVVCATRALVEPGNRGRRT